MLQGLFGIAGIGLGIAGGLEGAAGAKQAAGDEMAIAGYEMQADQQRRQAMELNAQRQSLQYTRNQQMMRAMATENATAQGAQFGSGLQGGLATITGGTASNQSALSQSLQIGRNLFDINMSIDAARIDEASAKSKEASGAGLAGLGKGLIGFGDLIGKFGGGSFGG